MLVTNVYNVASKKTWNPGTGKFYKSRQRNTETGKKDDIPGLWNQPPEKKEKEKK